MGTASGTRKVTSFVSGQPGSAPSWLTSNDGLLFFIADDQAGVARLWSSNGTEPGTHIVGNLESTLPGGLTELTGDGQNLNFIADEDTLWISDGTESGTRLVKDLGGDGVAASLEELISVDGTIFFRADDGTHGSELWVSDGTEIGTQLVRDIASDPGASSHPGQLTNVNGTLVFVADDGLRGRELWQSDGTPAGTTLIADIRVGSDSADPVNLTNIDGVLYFAANDGVHGSELGEAIWSAQRKSLPIWGPSRPTDCPPQRSPPVIVWSLQQIIPSLDASWSPSP